MRQYSARRNAPHATGDAKPCRCQCIAPFTCAHTAHQHLGGRHAFPLAARHAPHLCALGSSGKAQNDQRNTLRVCVRAGRARARSTRSFPTIVPLTWSMPSFRSVSATLMAFSLWICVRARAGAPARTCACVSACRLACVRARVSACVRASARECVRASARACVSASVRASVGAWLCARERN